MAGVEIEFGKGNHKFYLKVYFDPDEIWVDLKALGDAAFLCAMHDGTGLMEVPVGPKCKSIRMFVNIEWAIHKWGGPKKIVDALKVRKKLIFEEMDSYKKEYKKDWECCMADGIDG